MSIPKGPFKNKKEIILASKSPRRQHLLSLLGIYFKVMVSNAKEINSSETPCDLVRLNAQKKALDVSKQIDQGVIISADTVVVFENEILGKPKDKKDAIHTLSKLAGKWHEVYTGCCVIDKIDSKIHTEEFVAKTKVLMDNFNPEIIYAYVNTKEPMDKAGSYAIQGVGTFMVKAIDGSYTNVVGLPLNELVNILLKIDAIGV